MPLPKAQVVESTEVDYDQLLFLRRSSGSRKNWHRILHYFPGNFTHMTYCGRLETYNPVRFVYSITEKDEDETHGICTIMYHAE